MTTSPAQPNSRSPQPARQHTTSLQLTTWKSHQCLPSLFQQGLMSWGPSHLSATALDSMACQPTPARHHQPKGLAGCSPAALGIQPCPKGSRPLPPCPLQATALYPTLNARTSTPRLSRRPAAWPKPPLAQQQCCCCMLLPFTCLSPSKSTRVGSGHT